MESLTASGVVVESTPTLKGVAAPVGWYNTVIGFQSQFHFLLLCAFGHLALTLSSAPRQARWWVGQAVGVAGLFSMASGFLSGAALIAIAALRACKRREAGVRLWANLAVGAALIAAGSNPRPSSATRSVTDASS